MSALQYVQSRNDEISKRSELSVINREEQGEKEETEEPFLATVGGLTSSDVDSQRKQYGYNELSESKPNPVLKFLSYFWGPIPWMIEIAAILSALVKHWEDLAVILILLVVNAIVGFWEEYKAGNTIAALKNSYCSCDWNTGAGNPHCGVWPVYEPAWLGMGAAGMGIRAGLVLCK